MMSMIGNNDHHSILPPGLFAALLNKIIDHTIGVMHGVAKFCEVILAFEKGVNWRFKGFVATKGQPAYKKWWFCWCDRQILAEFPQSY